MTYKQMESLKECKETYDKMEHLSNLLDYDLGNEFELAMQRLNDIYQKIYETIDEKDLKTNLKCCKCNREKVYISDLIDYNYVCKECDENLYSIETYGEY